MTEHISLDRIMDRIADADRHDAGEIVSHLATCDRCREADRWMREVMEAAAAGEPPTAPEEVVERALAIPAEAPRSGKRRAWSIARLVEGAFAKPALAGVRGGGAGQRLLYRIPGGHLDIEITPAPEDGEALRLTGQLLLDEAPPVGDLLAALWRDRTMVARATGDLTGLFVLAPVPPGVYRLDLLALKTGGAVRVGQITLEARDP
ncbi:MAG: hypothetical protein L0027_05250 [Candidatus Rokubacteria bacterium]|nr:hypothetical protein [Candidatus Rokubacteria bacterium]